MQQYYVDLNNASVPIPCAFVNSVESGKMLLTREADGKNADGSPAHNPDGSPVVAGASMVIEPNGSQVRWMAPTDLNFDSAWTRFTPMSGFAVFRSDSTDPPMKGVPVMFRMIV